MRLGKYIQERLLLWIKGTAFPDPPEGAWLTIFTTMPDVDDTGYTEPEYDGYERIDLTGVLGDVHGLEELVAYLLNDANGDETDIIEFAEIPADDTEGVYVVGFGILDAETVETGNMIAVGDVPNLLTLPDQSPRIPASLLRIETS